MSWTVRVRSAHRDEAVAYARGHELRIGRPLHFDEEYDQLTALEAALGAIGADIAGSLRREVERRRLELDRVEVLVRCELQNANAYLGVIGEVGTPGIANLDVRIYAESFEEDHIVQEALELALTRSPLACTLRPLGILQVRLELSV